MPDVSVCKHIKKAENKIWPAWTFLFSNPLFAAKNIEVKIVLWNFRRLP